MAHENNVVPMPFTPPAPKGEADIDNNKLNARWGARLAKPFSPVSRYFLHNYWRLAPHSGARGLNSTEAMLIIQILDHKWDERAPFPTLATLGQRMGLSPRALRSTVKRLEELKYITREPSPYGGPNKYHFDGLIKALHELMDKDVEEQDVKEVAGG